MRNVWLGALMGGLLSTLLVGAVQGQELQFKDPRGDDKGPGVYSYPTDGVYAPGSFDLTGFSIKDKGKDVEFKITLAARIEDPWDSKAWGGNGFSVQFVQIYIDLDHKEGSGELKALPGINVAFAPTEAWDKVVLLSPQGATRLQTEIDTKAGKIKDKMVIPTVVRATGNSLTAVVPKSALGDLKPGYGFQVVMQSNEGYPAATDLLTRKVNEYNGEHRFGGGSDYDCDPHVIDMLMAPGKGEKSEQDAQFEALKKFTCADDESKWSLATVPLIYTPAATPAEAPAATPATK
ncbi:MAG: glucodextranase DOMON-like domain-containing protein [Myxococcota bacterium]